MFSCSLLKAPANRQDYANASQTCKQQGERNTEHDASHYVQQMICLELNSDHLEVENTTTQVAKAAARELIMSWLREPLLHFLVLGALVWSVGGFVSNHQNRYTIHLGSQERQRVVNMYVGQFGQLPSQEQLRELIDRYVRQEIFFREGLALGLGKDDEIIRRRIVQRYEFLQTDLAVSDLPAPGVLQQWFEKNKLTYLSPGRISFTHVFFSSDRDGEAGAKSRAGRVLKKLKREKNLRAPALGDPFPGPVDIAASQPEDVVRIFGDSDLSKELFALKVGQWAGPFRSGYGWHLVYVTGHLPPKLPALSEIRERVLADYMEDQRRTLNVRNFEKLRAKYTIRYDGDK